MLPGGRGLQRKGLMQTSSSFRSPSSVISSLHTIFHPSFGVCLSKVHTPSQHNWFGNHRGKCRRLCAQPLLVAKPVPCGTAFPREQVPRGVLLHPCILDSTAARVSHASELCLFLNGRKIKTFQTSLLWGSQVGLKHSLFFLIKSHVVWELFC